MINNKDTFLYQQLIEKEKNSTKPTYPSEIELAELTIDINKKKEHLNQLLRGRSLDQQINAEIEHRMASNNQVQNEKVSDFQQIMEAFETKFDEKSQNEKKRRKKIKFLEREAFQLEKQKEDAIAKKNVYSRIKEWVQIDKFHAFRFKNISIEIECLEKPPSFSIDFAIEKNEIIVLFITENETKEFRYH